MTESELMHINFVLTIDQKYFLAVCGCGLTSTSNNFKHVDLLREMQAHAVVTFQAYT